MIDSEGGLDEKISVCSRRKLEVPRGDEKRRRGISLWERPSRVRIVDFAQPPFSLCSRGLKAKDFLQFLPQILAGRDFRELIQRMYRARERRKRILWGLGAHVIKVGLAPLVVRLVNEGWIQGIALNGAGMIHDFEIAFAGCTSEDVEAALKEGTFGFTVETGRELNRAINQGVKKGWGIGESVGQYILKEKKKFPYRDLSIIASAVAKRVPVTVHVTIGADVINLHSECRGELLGKGSLQDFRTFCHLVERLEGGVYLNIGSAVTLPEVFLKAIASSRNREKRNFGIREEDELGITTAVFDFQLQYRAKVNVVERPVNVSGPDSRGYYFIGAHEILIPLLTWALLDYPG